jgi:polyisoprenoid-binding protein YceI
LTPIRTVFLAATAALAGSFAVAPAARAADAAPAANATDLAKAEAGHYKIDKRHAKVIFAINHLGFSTYYGIFNDFTDSSFDFDPAAPQKSALSLTLNVAGMVTTDPELDEKLKSDAFFDTAKFPTATFKSTAIEMSGANTGKLTGDLTLHGVTKPVTLDVSFAGAGTPPMQKFYVIGFNATGKLKRSDFGIKNYIPLLGDEVELRISAEFDRAP